MLNVLTGGLPFEVESLDAAAARYPAALKREWDGDAIAAAQGECDRPGLHREHVFDVEWGHDGDDYVEWWRVIVSIETHAEIGRVLHISASALHNPPALVPFFYTRAMLLYAFLSGINGRLIARRQFMHGQVAHLIFDVPTSAVEGGGSCR